MVKVAGPAGAVVLLAAILLATPLWRGFLAPLCAHGLPDPFCGARPEYRLYKATDTRLDSIAWGALVAVLAFWRPALAARLAEPRWQAPALGALLAGFLIRDPWFREVPRTLLQGLALSVLIPGLLVHGGAVRRLCEAAPALFVGRLSYGIYLWHWGALALADALAPPGHEAWLLAAILGTVLLSLASWHGIERPMLRLRRRAGSAVPPASAAAIARLRPVTG